MHRMIRNDEPRRTQLAESGDEAPRAGAWQRKTIVPAACELHARLFPATDGCRRDWTVTVLLLGWVVRQMATQNLMTQLKP